MIFLFIAGTVLLIYLASVGYLIYVNGMAPDSKDRNLTPDKVIKAGPPPKKATEYRRFAYNYNIWWNLQKLEEVSITSFDGFRLFAKLFRADRESRKVAVVCHGHRCCSGEEGFISKMFHEAGFHVLAIEQRAHGVSEGSGVGMGILEKRDAVMWTYKASEMFPDSDIVLYGASMGGATVIGANALEMPENVKCVVEDCGYTSTFDVYLRSLYREFSFLVLKRLCTHAANIVCRLKQGFGMRDDTPLEAVSRQRLPLMIIHGQKDDLVFPEMGEKLYEACNTEKRILRVEGAGHNVSFKYAPDEYREKVLDFVDHYFSK